MNTHPATIIKVRDFQPPWRRVLVYGCTETGIETRVRIPKGGLPPGAIIGNCKHLIRF